MAAWRKGRARFQERMSPTGCVDVQGAGMAESEIFYKNFLQEHAEMAAEPGI